MGQVMKAWHELFTNFSFLLKLLLRAPTGKEEVGQKTLCGENLSEEVTVGTHLTQTRHLHWFCAGNFFIIKCK